MNADSGAGEPTWTDNFTYTGRCGHTIAVANGREVAHDCTARCDDRNAESGQCRLYRGHEGHHGDGEGTVWGGQRVPDWTGAETVRRALERSPLLESVKAARATPDADDASEVSA